MWEIGAPFEAHCEGIDAIVEMLHNLRDQRISFTQLVPTGVISIDGDVAEARWLARVDGEWSFTRRSYKYMWLNTENLRRDGVRSSGVRLIENRRR